MQLHFPFNEKNHILFQIHDIDIDDGAEARSYFCFIRLYDDVVEDREYTIPIMRDMDDNYLSKSDNFDTQRMYLKICLRVVSAIYPRDRAVSQLLHNKPITDERWPT